MADIAFVLAASTTPPDPMKVIASAHQHDLPLEIDPDGQNPSGNEISSFTFGDGRPGMLMYTFLPVPHPDAQNMHRGPLSPSDDELKMAGSHLILVGFGLDGRCAERDTVMYRFASAVSKATNAVAAMLGHAVNAQRADVLQDLTGLIADHGIPSELAVTVSTKAVDQGSMTILTHGLARLGREEFLLRCPIDDDGAMNLIFDIARWSLADPELELPSGDTVGRTENEQLVVGRIPHPTEPNSSVVTLTPVV